MRVEIIIDPNLADDVIKIYTKEYRSELQALEQLFHSKRESLVGFQADEAFVLKVKDLIRIYSEDKQIYLENSAGTYRSRLRLYELENIVGSAFIRISQSELINREAIRKLDLSFQGTIAVSLTNGQVSYVSRRQVKAFKKELGL